MPTFQEMFVNFTLIALMITSIFGLIITHQLDNDVTDPLTDDKFFNDTFNQLRSDTENFEQNSSNAKALFEEEDPKLGFGSLLLKSIKSGGTIFTGIITSTANIVVNMLIVVFLVDPVIVSVIFTILTIAIIIGLWIVYKLGG